MKRTSLLSSLTYLKKQSAQADVSGAIEGYKRLLTRYPGQPECLFQLGLLLTISQKYDEASVFLSRLLSQDPAHEPARINLAYCLLNLGQAEASIKESDLVLRTNPKNRNALLNKSLALIGLAQPKEALETLDQLLKIDHTNFKAAFNRGVCFLLMENFREAEDIFLSLHLIFPKNIDLNYQLGITYSKLYKHQKAIRYFDFCLEIEPRHTHALAGRAFSLTALKNFESALGTLEKGLENDNRNYLLLYQKAIVLRKKNLLDESILTLENALKVCPDHPQSNFNLSTYCLYNFDFERGWYLYKNRWAIEEFHQPLKTTIPSWSGEKNQESLTIICEQGIGDQILHSNFFNLLKQYTEKIRVFCDPRLIPIFKRSFPKMEFFSIEILDLLEVQPDRWIYSGDLGAIFIKNLDSFKQFKSPLLVYEKCNIGLAHQNIRENKVTCGVSWISQSKDYGKNKSFPIDLLIYTLKKFSWNFLDLSYHDSSTERALMMDNSLLLVRDESINYFLEIDKVFSLVSQCDVIITVSNVVAHYAGALGKRTILLLPFSDGVLWYWHSKEGRSVWYPSVQIIQQDSYDNWDKVVEHLSKILQSFESVKGEI